MEENSHARSGESEAHNLEAVRSPGGTSPCASTTSSWSRRLEKGPRLEVAGGKCAPAEAEEEEEESLLSEVKFNQFILV